jgi:hypothetical protein
MARLRPEMCKRWREAPSSRRELNARNEMQCECRVDGTAESQPPNLASDSNDVSLSNEAPAVSTLSASLNKHMGSKAGNTPEVFLRHVQLVRLSSPQH